MDDDQNPLRSQLENELNESTWLQKFKALSTLLQTLKSEVPLTQLCQVKWDTDTDVLLIHCPNPDIRTALSKQALQLEQIKGCATRIILTLADHPDIIIG